MYFVRCCANKQSLFSFTRANYFGPYYAMCTLFPLNISTFFGLFLCNITTNILTF